VRVLRNRRGVSPLIATIMLIAFAVALGAVVMQFGAGLESSSCGADIQIIAESACIGASTIEVSVKNVGAADIGKLQFWVHGSDGAIKTQTSNVLLTRSSTDKTSVEYQKSAFGAPKKIEIIPFLENGLQCEENKVVTTRIGSC